jgi:hypothetical protein
MTPMNTFELARLHQSQLTAGLTGRFRRRWWTRAMSKPRALAATAGASA